MVVICFPGGSGGHYIGYLIRHLLDQTPCSHNAQVNFHKMFAGTRSFLNFSFLDHSGHSQEEESVYIRQLLPNRDIVLGHFRNASEIFQQHRAKIVCVRVGDHTRDLLVNRVLREAIDHNFDKVKYNDVRGTDWPKSNPGYAQLPKWIQLEIQSMLYKMFEYWNNQINVSGIDPEYICELSSDEVFTGDVVGPLTRFLRCDLVPGMQEIQKHYQQLVQQKYNLV